MTSNQRISVSQSSRPPSLSQLHNDAEKARIYSQCPSLADLTRDRSMFDPRVVASISDRYKGYASGAKKRKKGTRDVTHEQAYARTRLVELHRLQLTARPTAAELSSVLQTAMAELERVRNESGRYADDDDVIDVTEQRFLQASHVTAAA